jgi:dCMP deaminase
MKIRPDWDSYFMMQLPGIAVRSHDTTEVGCIIVSRDRRPKSQGYNGLPSGVDERIIARYERPEKYLWMEHAERNAIFSAARAGSKLDGCTMYVNWFPCAPCARAIIQAGIAVLICDAKRTRERKDDPQWKHEFEVAAEMLEEAGVVVNYWEEVDEELEEAA